MSRPGLENREGTLHERGGGAPRGGQGGQGRKGADGEVRVTQGYTGGSWAFRGRQWGQGHPRVDAGGQGQQGIDRGSCAPRGSQLGSVRGTKRGTLKEGGGGSQSLRFLHAFQNFV